MDRCGADEEVEIGKRLADPVKSSFLLCVNVQCGAHSNDLDVNEKDAKLLFVLLWVCTSVNTKKQFGQSDLGYHAVIIANRSELIAHAVGSTQETNTGVGVDEVGAQSGSRSGFWDLAL